MDKVEVALVVWGIITTIAALTPPVRLNNLLDKIEILRRF